MSKILNRGNFLTKYTLFGKKKLFGHKKKKIKNKEITTIIQESGYFNTQYYLDSNPYVKKAGVDPLWHFAHHGGKEGRNPSVKFDSAYYEEVKGIRGTKTHALLHYIDNNNKDDLNDEYSQERAKKYWHNQEKKLISDINKSTIDTKLVIYIESMNWQGELQQRPHHLARFFAINGCTVVYIDASIKDPYQVNDRLFVVPRHDKYIMTKTKNNSIHSYYWLFSTTPKKIDELLTLKNHNFEIIYDFIDDIHEDITVDVSVQLENYEKLDIIKPVLLVASASNLFKMLKDRFTDKDIVLAENAVDINDFIINRRIELPRDIRKCIDKEKPIVGFYGAIAPWLDYEMINALTEKRTDLEFIFIGVDYGNSLQNLEIRSNVLFLGPKPYKKLHMYSRLFDCAIIPFKFGDIAKSTSPVKLFEYMAMGVPTVCTRDLTECKGYDYVYVSKTHKEFEKNIDIAIKARNTKKAQDTLLGYAKQNTWDARAKTIIKHIKTLSNKDPL